LTICVDEHWIAATLIDAIDAGDKRRRVICLIADADGVRFTGDATVADVYIVVTRG
jgi:hypothetical protein